MISYMFISESHKLAGDATKNQKKIVDSFKKLTVVQVTGEDVRDQEIEHLMIDVKALTKTAPLDLYDLSVSIAEEDQRTTLTFRNCSDMVSGITGYNTWMAQEFGAITNGQTTLDLSVDSITASGYDFGSALDLDGDGSTDTVYVCDDGTNSPCIVSNDGTHLGFEFSSDPGVIHYAPLQNQDNSWADMSAGGQVLDVYLSPIDDGDWGYVSVSGTTLAAYTIGSLGEVVDYSAPLLVLDTDVDDDGQEDYISVNATHVLVDLSSLTDFMVYPLGGDISTAPATLSTSFDVTGAQRYGSMVIEGTTTQDDTIDASMTFEFTPYHNGGGYYCAEYLRRGEWPIEGYLVPGDVVRFHVETYNSMSTGEVFKIQFYYKDLESNMKGVYTGDTFPYQKNIVLFPKP